MMSTADPTSISRTVFFLCALLLGALPARSWAQDPPSESTSNPGKTEGKETSEQGGESPPASGADAGSPGSDPEEGPTEPSPDATTDSTFDTSAPMTPDGSEVLAYRGAVQRAVEENHDVEISRTETRIAERNVSLGNADFLPRVEGVANQRHQFGGSGLFGQGQVFTQTSLGVQAEWLLFGGLGRFSTYDRLKVTRTLRTLEQQARIERTLVEVSVAYYDVVRQRQLLEAYRETRELSEQRLQIARSRHEAGIGSKVDVNLANVELYRDRSAVAEQKVALTEAKTELNRVMGRDAETSFRVDASVEVARGLAYEEIREQSMEQNRNLRAARRRTEIAGERIEEVQSERWPDVQLTLGYNYTEFHDGITPQFDSEAGAEYGINVVVPIFDGFNINRRVENARSERTISKISVRREKTRVLRDLRDADEAYRRHLQRIEYAEQSIELAEENVEIALTELRAGTITQVELRQVQLNLQDARTRLINAKYNAKRAELRLRRLAGQLYDDFM